MRVFSKADPHSDCEKDVIIFASSCERGPLTPQEKALLAAHAMEGTRMLYASQGANRLPAIAAGRALSLRKRGGIGPVDLSQQKGSPRPVSLKLVATQAFATLEPRELEALG